MYLAACCADTSLYVYNYCGFQCRN